MRFNRIDHIRIPVIVTVGILAGCVSSTTPPATPGTPVNPSGDGVVYRSEDPAFKFSQITVPATVEYVLELPHFSIPDKNSRAAIEKLKANPREAVRAIETQTNPRQALGNEDRLSLIRFENAILLLGAIAAPETDALLARWYTDMEDRVPLIPDGSMSASERSTNLILEATRGRYVPPIFKDLLADWGVRSPSQRAISINYLYAAAVASPDAADALRRFASSGAPGTDDPLLVQALGRLR